MHLLDTHVTPAVAATAAALALPAVVPAFRASKMSPGVTAAAVAFTLGAQAIDVPLPYGGSAHLLGGGVLAATFGVVPALRVMIAVVVAQASWGDGGLMALGANLLNIALLPVLVAGALSSGGGLWRTATAAAAGTAVGVAACGLQLALSGSSPAAIGWDGFWLAHVPVALVEGAMEATLVAVGMPARVGVART